MRNFLTVLTVGTALFGQTTDPKAVAKNELSTILKMQMENDQALTKDAASLKDPALASLRDIILRSKETRFSLLLSKIEDLTQPALVTELMQQETHRLNAEWKTANESKMTSREAAERTSLRDKKKDPGPTERQRALQAIERERSALATLLPIVKECGGLRVRERQQFEKDLKRLEEMHLKLRSSLRVGLAMEDVKRLEIMKPEVGRSTDKDGVVEIWTYELMKLKLFFRDGLLERWEENFKDPAK